LKSFIDLKADQVIVKNIPDSAYNVTCQLSINVTQAGIYNYFVTIYPNKPGGKEKYGTTMERLFVA
ncbi:hypothetical protein BgiBS90_018940, partial [Biomphalaria glabrata]